MNLVLSVFPAPLSPLKFTTNIVLHLKHKELFAAVRQTFWKKRKQQQQQQQQQTLTAVSKENTAQFLVLWWTRVTNLQCNRLRKIVCVRANICVGGVRVSGVNVSEIPGCAGQQT